MVSRECSIVFRVYGIILREYIINLRVGSKIFREYGIVGETTCSLLSWFLAVYFCVVSPCFLPFLPHFKGKPKGKLKGKPKGKPRRELNL